MLLESLQLVNYRRSRKYLAVSLRIRATDVAPFHSSGHERAIGAFYEVMYTLHLI